LTTLFLEMNMTTLLTGTRRLSYLAALLGLAVLLTGCDAPVARFRGNMVAVRANMGKEYRTQDQHVKDIADILAAMFGTPDEPHVPSLSDVNVAAVLDIDKLRMAAGPVGSDEFGRPRGLYRQHCSHCHGVTGDGIGPTAAFLNPYPRDYRLGKFKFKSTPIGYKPTHDDLTKILVDGIPGTAMPSFALLDNDEIDALVHYVKYLSIRGEMERDLIRLAATLDLEAKPPERIVSVALAKEKPGDFAEQLEELKRTAARLVTQWQNANSNVMEVAPPSRDMRDPQVRASAVRHGRELFYGAVANCFSCHGDSALGDGKVSYDDWAKDPGWIDGSTNQPIAEQIPEFLSLGALEPRVLRPRNLRQGIYRGGRRPVDVYWRIRNGIEGTPMPAAAFKPEGSPEDMKGLTHDDIWDLVEYLRSLPYESISQPAPRELENLRERS
jgi:mono/diheme cytochrome c family protein